MKHERRWITLPLLLGLLGPAHASASNSDGVDWPQWRGPAQTGVSHESAWNSVGKAEPLWVKSLGLGHSSFAIADGRMFTLGYDAEEGMDAVFCFDAATGEEKWSHRYPSEIWDVAHDGGTTTTPTVVGSVVYTSNREGKVFCFDVSTGEVRWSRDLRADYGLEPPTWGFSASPLVVEDLLVMNVDRVIALDRASGEEVWATEKNYGIAYSTPAVMEQGGELFLASLSGDGLAALRVADGSEVDFYDWVREPQIYPMTPVIIDDRIFISAGYERGRAMLRFTGDELEELWASRVMRNKMSGCVLWKDHLFGFDESILKCIALDGTERWRKRGLGTGSMSVVGDRLLIQYGKGQIIVAEANPEEYIELSRQDVLDDGTAWSTPVLSHGRVYCRSSLGQMVCLDYSSDAAPAEELASAKGTADLGGELPTAEALVARHVAAIGPLPEFTSIRLSGNGESLRNTVQTGRVDLDWGPELGFSWKDASGFQVAHTPELGWMVGVRSGPQILQGEDLQATREAGDLARLFAPASFYTSLQTTERTVFDNRPCFAVAARTEEGYARTLYFEVESGLYAGHQGEGIPMWTVRDYRNFEGLLLPTAWAFYEPVKGEMNSAVFDQVERDGSFEASPFAVPPVIQMLDRTPEEIAQANERLEQRYAALLGQWRPEDDPSGTRTMGFEVFECFLMFVRPDREPTRMAEPAEDGVLVMIGAEYVSFTPERGDSGEIEGIQIRVGEELRDRLVRSGT